MRYAAGVKRRGAAREAGHREIEAAPEEMNGTRLADEAGAELLEDAVGIAEDLQKAPHGLRVVGRVCGIL